MTQLLLIVGLVVFFFSVYGAVLTGGHLLEQLESDSDNAATPVPGWMSDAPSKSDPQAATG